MKKKWLSVLIAVLCALALAACGGAAVGEAPDIDEEIEKSLFGLTETTVQQLDEVVASGLVEDQKDNKSIYDGLHSWASAREEIGEVDFTGDADGNGVADCFTEESVTVDDDGQYIVTVGVSGAQKSAKFVATYDKDVSEYVALVTNVDYTKAELIQQAGLNTLLGMGTTFCVLILLSVIIALFGRTFTSRSKKKAEEEAARAVEPLPPEGAGVSAIRALGQGSLAPQEGQPDEGTLIAILTAAVAHARQDDGALVAVISAAVAAYRAQEGGVEDPNAFVVRHIRRIRRKR